MLAYYFSYFRAWGKKENNKGKKMNQIELKIGVKQILSKIGSSALKLIIFMSISIKRYVIQFIL